MIAEGPLTPEEEAAFKAYLARLRTIPQEIKWEWPEVEDAHATLAWGSAIALPGKVDERAERRAKRAVSKLHKEQIFKAEVMRLAALVGPATSQPADSGSLEDFWASYYWSEAERQRGEVIRRESYQFATDHQFPYMSHEAVVVALVDAVNQRLPGYTVPRPHTAKLDNDGAPTIYVNPLSDTDVSAPVGPGRILVDLTNASYEDLQAFAPVLTGIQKRLGYAKQRGRRYEGNAEQMAFVHRLSTSTTGRGRKWTWKQVRDKFQEKFQEDLSEATLMQRYKAWQRWNESTE